MVSGRSEAIVVNTAVFLGLSLCAGSLRCLVRFHLTHAAGCDDYLMVAAMVGLWNSAIRLSLMHLDMQFFNIGFGTCTILGAVFGIGKKLIYFEGSMASFRKAMLVGNKHLETQKRC